MVILKKKGKYSGGSTSRVWSDSTDGAAMESLTEKGKFGRRFEGSERLSYSTFGEEHCRKCSMARVEWNL